MIYTNDYESPLGNILLAGDEQGLTGLWFTEGGRYTGLGLKKGASRRETDYFDQTKKWLDIYFSGRDPGFFPQIHLVSSDFRNRVGEIMCEIPYGKTVTYGWIADKLAKERGLERMSAQAVGGGNLTGYGGGILRKKALLELEGNDMSQFTIPTKGTAL